MTISAFNDVYIYRIRNGNDSLANISLDYSIFIAVVRRFQAYKG